ncbi:hypothetical protein CAP39_03455 [Sphingomonas sp. IBVSS1]|nr:hypothetical protein CAP39_03455 [Sphingomonas sp. IBVSS1]
MCGLAVLALAAAAPAAAQRYFVTVSGGLLLGPAANPIPELAQFAGQSFFASFVINGQPSTFTASGPIGGQGESGFWSGAVEGGLVAIFAPGGAITFTQKASDPGNLFLINNGGVPGNANRRTDQIGISAGVTSFDANGPVLPYDFFNSVGFAGLPSDVFLGSLTFALSENRDLPTLPGLLTDLSAPDFGAILQQPGSSPFLSLRFRRGTASNQSQLLALPAQSLTSTALSYTVTPLPGGVPEPASWLMLIIGFGATGTALRRRAARSTAAA